MNYQRRYMPRFEKDLKTYPSLRGRIPNRVDQVAADPYSATEQLGHPPGALNLKGCRSARVGQNFRIIFTICEECRKEPECEYCFCEGLPDQTIVLLTVRPHEKAYRMK